MLQSLRGQVGGLLGEVLRIVDEVPCPLRALLPSGPAPVEPPPPPATTGTPAPAEPGPPSPPAAPAAIRRDAPVGAGGIEEFPLAPVEAGAPLPPGPWRWRWVWPTPGRPAGMALIAADDSLLLWSPGGFAAADGPADGRPTPELAHALAGLPELTDAAGDVEQLRVELARARAVADETRRLLRRAAGAVDDEIGRHGTEGAPGRG